MYINYILEENFLSLLYLIDCLVIQIFNFGTLISGLSMLGIILYPKSTCSNPAFLISLHNSFSQINKYLLNTYYMPGTFFSLWCTVVNATKQNTWVKYIVYYMLISTTDKNKAGKSWRLLREYSYIVQQYDQVWVH